MSIATQTVAEPGGPPLRQSSVFSEAPEPQSFWPRPRPAPRERPAAPDPDDHVWYGAQIFLADAVALALTATSTDERNWQLPTGLALFGFGGPVVHLGNHEPLRALGSLGLRAAGVGTAYFTALKVGCHDTYESGQERTTCSEAFAAALLVLVGTSLLDGGLLAHRAPFSAQAPPSEAPPSEHHFREPRFMLVPTLAVTPKQASVGALLQF